MPACTPSEPFPARDKTLSSAQTQKLNQFNGPFPETMGETKPYGYVPQCKRVVIYARTSTGDGRQHLENQIGALRSIGERLNWNVVEIITDEVSGTRGRDKRPGFDRLHKGVAMAEWDLIACFAIDRLGRSIQGLLAFLTEAHERGIGVFCLQNGFDSSSASGRLMAGLLGLFASYETEILRERIRAGLARVRAEGKKIGRPGLDASTRDQIVDDLRHGKGIRAISRATGVAPVTVRRVRAEVVIGAIGDPPANSVSISGLGDARQLLPLGATVLAEIV